MRHDPTKDIPVVMCSSEDTMDSVDKCLTLGANDYVVKPFEMARLKAKLTPYLKQPLFSPGTGTARLLP